MFIRNGTTKNTCNSAPTTIGCAVGEKSKFKVNKSVYIAKSRQRYH